MLCFVHTTVMQRSGLCSGAITVCITCQSSTPSLVLACLETSTVCTPHAIDWISGASVRDPAVWLARYIYSHQGWTMAGVPLFSSSGRLQAWWASPPYPSCGLHSARSTRPAMPACLSNPVPVPAGLAPSSIPERVGLCSLVCSEARVLELTNACLQVCRMNSSQSIPSDPTTTRERLSNAADLRLPHELEKTLAKTPLRS